MLKMGEMRLEIPKRFAVCKFKILLQRYPSVRTGDIQGLKE